MLTLFLIVFIDLVGFGILLPNQQYYGKEFGIDRKYLLILIGVSYSLFQFIFAPILGKWSDKIGRRPVLLISQFGTLLGYLMLYSAHLLQGWSLPIAIFLIYFSRVIDGISGGNISTAFAYVADITTPENRAKGMGVVGAALGLGFIFGPMIGGIVGKHLGLHYVPLTAAIFSVVTLVMTYWKLPESHHPGKVTEGQRRFSVGGLRRALTRPVIGILIWLVFINGFAFAGMEQTFSLLIQERAELKTGEEASGYSGYLFCGIGVIIVLVQGGLIGRLTKVLGEKKLIVIGPMLIAGGLLLVGLAGMYQLAVWPMLIAGSGLLALGSSLFNPSIQSLISRQVDKNEQGDVLGATQGMASLARVVGPLVLGLLYDFVSSGSAYYVAAVLSFVVAVKCIGVKDAPPTKSNIS